MRLLIIDENRLSAGNLAYSMEQDDYEVKICTDPKNELQGVLGANYDIIVMELDYSNINGLTIIQSIRRTSTIPIIVTTENDDDIQKILALEYGADDYLIKPYNILELKVRIKAIMRRLKSTFKDTDDIDIKFDEYIIKPVGRVLVKDDSVVSLTGKEFDLIYVLGSNPGKVFSREELMTKVWGYDYYGDVRSIDVHIRRIREKIEKEPKNPKCLLTKWGQGYYFYDYNK